MDDLADSFDEATLHGLNPKVDTHAGIEYALRKRDQNPAATKPATTSK